MRKLLILLVPLGLLAGTSALARPPADGTLSVRDARGLVQLSARGSITGRFDRGKVTFTDPNPYDARRPIVYGQQKTIYRGPRTTVYIGRNVRFRAIGALFHLRIEGRGIYLSAIGRGRGLIEGAGDPSAGVVYDGLWSLNDEEYHSLPDELTGFQLAAAPSGG